MVLQQQIKFPAHTTVLSTVCADDTTLPRVISRFLGRCGRCSRGMEILLQQAGLIRTYMYLQNGLQKALSRPQKGNHDPLYWSHMRQLQLFYFGGKEWDTSPILASKYITFSPATGSGILQYTEAVCGKCGCVHWVWWSENCSERKVSKATEIWHEQDIRGKSEISVESNRERSLSPI